MHRIAMVYQNLRCKHLYIEYQANSFHVFSMFFPTCLGLVWSLWICVYFNLYAHIYLSTYTVHMYTYIIYIIYYKYILYMCQRVASKKDFQGFLASIVPPPEEV